MHAITWLLLHLVCYLKSEPEVSPCCANGFDMVELRLAMLGF